MTRCNESLLYVLLLLGQRKPEFAMRRVLRNQVINIGRVVSDLEFWIEVDKYGARLLVHQSSTIKRNANCLQIQADG